MDMVSGHSLLAMLGLLATTNAMAGAQLLAPVRCAPTRLGSYFGDASGLTASGSLIAVSHTSGHLWLVDASDLASPKLIARYPTIGRAVDAAIEGDLVFVATDAGLEILRITDPANPVTIATSQSVFSKLAAEGGLLIGIDGTELVVMDITDPLSPYEISRTQGPELLRTVGFASGHAWTADQSELRVWDLKDPRQPVPIETISNGQTPAQLIEQGGIRSILTYNLLTVSPIPGQGQAGWQSRGTPIGPALFMDVAFPYVAVAEFGPTGRGLSIWLHREPGDIQIVDSIDPILSVYDTVRVGPGWAFLDSGLGLRTTAGLVPGVGVPGSVEMVSGVSVSRIFPLDTEVLVHTTDRQLQAVDREPGPHGPARSYFNENPISRAAASDHVVATAFRDIISVYSRGRYSTPDGTVILPPGSLTDTMVAFGQWVVVGSDEAVFLIDASDPTAPYIAGSIPNGGPLHSGAVVGEALIVARNGQGATIYDISDPTAPVQLDSFVDRGSSVAVRTDGSQAAIIGDRARLYEISGNEVALVSDIDVPPLFQDYALLDGHLVCSFLSSRAVIDLTRSTCPVVVNWEFLGVGDKLSARDGLVYMATDKRSVEVFDFSMCIQDPCTANRASPCEALDFRDVGWFLEQFRDGDPGADWNADQQLNFFDLSAFLTAYSDGCPRPRPIP